MLAMATSQKQTRQHVVRRYLVRGVLWAEQRPVGGFAGARFEIGVNLDVTLRHHPDATPQLIRALALTEPAEIVALDCDAWRWEGDPLVVPLGGAR